MSGVINQFRKVDHASESRVAWKKAVSKGWGPCQSAAAGQCLWTFRELYSATGLLRPSPCQILVLRRFRGNGAIATPETWSTHSRGRQPVLECATRPVPTRSFFKVLRANPIAKTLLRPSHASYSTATASVCICEVSGNDLLTWTHRPSKRMPLDLTCLSRLDNLRRLKVWKSAIGSAEACVSDDIVDHLAG